MPQSDDEQSVRVSQLTTSIEFGYANVAQITTTKWDIRLAFGHRVDETDAFPVCGVVMSHLHAKELAGILAKTIENLEEIVGPIEDPEAKILEHNRKIKEAQGDST